MVNDTSFLDDIDISDGQITRVERKRKQYAVDYGTPKDEGVTPDVVVFPESTDDVSLILSEANEHGVPVTPYAAGTSTEGQGVPVHGGITMDLTRMNAIVDVSPDDLQIEVEAGIMGAEINEAVESHGLFFPPLPSSGDISTIGGMIANDASGMQTVKYGEVGDWTRKLEVVLPDGTVIEPGSRAPKSSSGYNILDLIVGSEGTLGIVTRATLELAGIPEQIWAGRAEFESTTDAANAIFDAIKSGVDVSRIELMDSLSVKIANSHIETGLPDTPMVFFEFHANHGIDEEVDFCRGVFEDKGARSFVVSGQREEFEKIWEARRQIGHALPAYIPEFTPLTIGDVTVPISAYPELVSYVREVGDDLDLLLPCFGHGGDGNLHYTILVDTEDDDLVERGWTASDRIIERAIDLGGTSTGEHGIGIGKRKHLTKEHSEAGVDVMLGIKRAFDPNGILNPGKIFPDDLYTERYDVGGQVE